MGSLSDMLRQTCGKTQAWGYGVLKIIYKELILTQSATEPVQVNAIGVDALAHLYQEKAFNCIHFMYIILWPLTHNPSSVLMSHTSAYLLLLLCFQAKTLSRNRKIERWGCKCVIRDGTIVFSA